MQAASLEKYLAYLVNELQAKQIRASNGFSIKEDKQLPFGSLFVN